MRWKWLVLLWGAAVLLGSMGFSAVGQQGKEPQRRYGVATNARLKQIPGDCELWGKDFPNALGYLQNSKRLGECKSAVYPHHLVGETSYWVLGKPLQAAARLDEALGKVQPQSKLGRADVINVGTMRGDSPMSKNNQGPEKVQSHQQDPEKVQSQKEPKTEQEILDYWTQKRQDEAKPLPIPTPPPRSAEKERLGEGSK